MEKVKSKSLNRSVIVGYLVNSSKVEGELEFRSMIGANQNHLPVYYDLEKSLEVTENSNIVVEQIEDMDGYCLIEPLYRNEQTNSMIYVDVLNATFYNYNLDKDLPSMSAYGVAMEQIGYQKSYSRDDMKVVLDKMNQKESAKVKIK